VKAKRRMVTRSPRVADQKYPTAPKRPPTRTPVHGRTGAATSARAVPAPPVAIPPVAPANVDLSVDVGRGLVLPNPILAASGTFGYGVEYGDVVDLDRLGGICCRGTTLRARTGNPTPRMTETPGGLLNAVGLQSPGVDAVIARYAETWATLGPPVIVNIAAESVRDYVEIARRLDGVPGVAAIELNLSCPNLAAGGLQFALEAGAAGELTTAVRRATDLPLLAKLSPNVADIRPIARAIADAGADVLTAINTLSGLAVAADRARPLLGNLYGGLSGPAVKPVALRVVYEVAQAVKIPVVAIGGITGLADVLDFLAVGAVAVQVGTAIFADPTLPVRLVDELSEECGRRGMTTYRDLIGTALPKKPVQPSSTGAEYRP
jgi:dihydroorotate dehydrogenase (NAD+) catalytic subunit